jgi:predicted enzyme related to lactoylglutathione lyase
MAKTPLGQFVWHEVLTGDVDGARRFYGEVVGWGLAPSPDTASYHLWIGAAGPVAGCMALPAALAAKGVAPHWLSYIGTPNVDETAAKAKGLGGAVDRGPENIPGAGRFAVLSDPDGAMFCLYCAGSTAGAQGKSPDSGFSWHELATPNPNAARIFYGSLFGWERTSEYDMGPAGVYQVFGLGSRPLGGIYPQPADLPVPAWLPYAVVPDADQAAARAKSLGGAIAVEPMEVPGGTRIAVIIDPQGAACGLHAQETGG